MGKVRLVISSSVTEEHKKGALRCLNGIADLLSREGLLPEGAVVQTSYIDDHGNKGSIHTWEDRDDKKVRKSLERYTIEHKWHIIGGPADFVPDLAWCSNCGVVRVRDRENGTYQYWHTGMDTTKPVPTKEPPCLKVSAARFVFPPVQIPNPFHKG